MLAIEYMAGRPGEVVSLILADTTADMSLAIRGFARLRAELPDDVRAALDEAEGTGEIETPAYGQALFAFYQRHVCRLEQWPPELLAMGQSMMGNPVYLRMWGPNELTPEGNLSGWDRTDSLGAIDIPTLLTTGRYGEIVPDCAEAIHRAIPGSSFVLFEDSAHVPQFEEPERFRDVVGSFLARVEAR
jgi:L-proline amide hydrolase